MIRVAALVMTLFATLAPAGGSTAEPSQAGPRPASEEKVPPNFERLLGESAMRFEAPEGFQRVQVRPNPMFLYDRALMSGDGALEIRYAIRPLGRIVVDYQDPHSSAPDPNHMFPLMFQSMVTLLSNGRHSPARDYPRDQAQKKFNAHWAAAAVFDVSAEFATKHTQALVIALHKNWLADAYSIFLFDDYEQVKERINANLDSLAFLP